MTVETQGHMSHICKAWHIFFHPILSKSLVFPIHYAQLLALRGFLHGPIVSVAPKMLPMSGHLERCQKFGHLKIAANVLENFWVIAPVQCGTKVREVSTFAWHVPCKRLRFIGGIAFNHAKIFGPGKKRRAL